ncbi:MAG: C39 family peptidase [Clostridiales bacterium]|nr:C39 family peptidase [Clostridiales bacterium]
MDENKVTRLMVTACVSLVLITGVVCVAVSCKDSNDDIPPQNAINAAKETLVETMAITPSPAAADTEDTTQSQPDQTSSSAALDLSSEASGTDVPLLMQTDPRWSSNSYAGSTMADSGCGPTCLSMAALYLTGDGSYTPVEMALYAETNGLTSEGDGSEWTLITAGAAHADLSCAEVPKEKIVMQRLAASGVPMICAMGPGSFTQSGHYIVITGLQDNKFKVNDPNSQENSSRTWSYDEISDQIRNTWALWGTKLNSQQFTVTESGINVRDDSSINGQVKYKANTDKRFTIDKIANGGGYIWGHMDDGNWICMSYVKKQ